MPDRNWWEDPPKLICKLCEREIPSRSLAINHHLIPVHKGGLNKEKVLLCSPCGQQIHKLFSNSELKNKYNSIEKLKENDKVIEWVKWIKTTNSFNVCMKTKKGK